MAGHAASHTHHAPRMTLHHSDPAGPFGGMQQLPLAMAAAVVLPALPGGGVNDLFTNRVFLAGFWAWFTAQTLKVRTGAGPLRQRACRRPGVVDAPCAPAPGPMPLAHHHRRCRPQIFTKRLKKGVWDLRAIVDSGGMPSSHSALCAVSAPTPGKQGERGRCQARARAAARPAMHAGRCAARSDCAARGVPSPPLLQGITTAIAFQSGFGSSAFAVAVAFSSIVMYDAAGVRRHAGERARLGGGCAVQQAPRSRQPAGRRAGGRQAGGRRNSRSARLPTPRPPFTSRQPPAAHPPPRSTPPRPRASQASRPRC